MNRIKQYLDDRGVTTQQFADGVGVSFGMANKLRYGKRQPGLETAFAIERFTDGEIRASDFVSENSESAA